jgi:hypothetical protein
MSKIREYFLVLSLVPEFLFDFISLEVVNDKFRKLAGSNARADTMEDELDRLLAYVLSECNFILSGHLIFALGSTARQSDSTLTWRVKQLLRIKTFNKRRRRYLISNPSSKPSERSSKVRSLLPWPCTSCEYRFVS